MISDNMKTIFFQRNDCIIRAKKNIQLRAQTSRYYQLLTFCVDLETSVVTL